jgi:hypothetical protein
MSALELELALTSPLSPRPPPTPAVLALASCSPPGKDKAKDALGRVIILSAMAISGAFRSNSSSSPAKHATMCSHAAAAAAVRIHGRELRQLLRTGVGVFHR